MGEASPARPATLGDVAKRAGVSVPTASRILNGGVRGTQTGSADMRARVEEAAQTLGYSVSTAAQAIKGGRARSVALLVSDIDDFGSATMISGVMHAAEKRGMSVAVRATGDDSVREIDVLRQVRGERHRAVVLATSRTTDPAREASLDEELRLLRAQGARIVLVGDSALDYPSVTVDSRTPAARLAAELVRFGHRRFAVVSGPADQITARDRAHGFLAGLAAMGVSVPEERVVHAPFSRDGGYAAVDLLGQHIHDLDVIAAGSDAMAVGVIARLRELGLRSPGDIEVSGFDHVPMLSDVLPEFSTVEVPLEAFGEAALHLAVDEDGAGSTGISLPASLIVHGVRVDVPGPKGPGTPHEHARRNMS